MLFEVDWAISRQGWRKDERGPGGKIDGKKGEDIVAKNFNAIDQTLAHLYEVEVPDKAQSTREMRPVVPEYAPIFVRPASVSVFRIFTAHSSWSRASSVSPLVYAVTDAEAHSMIAFVATSSVRVQTAAGSQPVSSSSAA